MKQYTLRLLLPLLFVAAVASGGQSSRADDMPRPHEAILQLSPTADLDSLILPFNGSPVDSILSARMFLIEFPDSVALEAIILSLQNNPVVQLVQQNFDLSLPENSQVSIGFPDESMPDYLYGEEPNSYYAQTGREAVRLDSAHMLNEGEGLCLAIIDNGIDASHPAFAGRLLPGYDFFDEDSDPAEVTGTMYGHGTAVAGLALLAAPLADILPLRAFSGDGIGDIFSIADAIYFALDQGAAVINCSFGTYTNYPIIAEAVDSAMAAEVSIVAAVGNDAVATPSYPAAYPGVVGVSALTADELVASFSNSGSHVDASAPGEAVYTTLAGSPYDWGTVSGTSFAAPFVSGAIVLLKERRAELGPTTIETDVQASARVQTQWGVIPVPHTHYGFGILNAGELLTGHARGDLDNSLTITLTDLTMLVNYLFVTYAPPAVSPAVADINCDSEISLTDLTILVNYLFVTYADPRPCYPAD